MTKETRIAELCQKIDEALIKEQKIRQEIKRALLEIWKINGNGDLDPTDTHSL